MKRDLVLVVDFGGQYNQLIARRVRECGVYCEIIPYDYTIEKIKAKNPKGIIFTGGPNSVYGEDTPTVEKEVFELGVPVLGICYGDQLMAHLLGGKVATAPVREYGKTNVKLDKSSKLFEGIETDGIAWMSHTDYIEEAPKGFKVIATTEVCPVAAMENEEKRLYGVQFHAEVEHTQFGQKMLENFIHNICGLENSWSMDLLQKKK